MSGELDRALDRMHGCHPEYAGGLSSHGPMAAEALEALGHPERIAGFVDRYAAALEPFALAAPLADSERAAALGDAGRVGGWIAAFRGDLQRGDPFEVVRAALPQLASGWAAAAFHGPLRVAHAARALGHRDSAVRRTELAHGLGYWASRHVPLPGEPGARAERGLDVEAALARVPIVPAEARVPGGLIYDRLTVLARFPSFAAAVEAVDLDAVPIERALSLLAAAGARLLAHSERRASFAYLHTVTGTSALRILLPHLDAPLGRHALGYVFQAVAAIHATHGAAPGLPEAPAAPDVDLAALAAAAAADPDEHTIKLVEAALREHAIDPRPELLAAAASRVR
jgi:hypothetical protein